jgi:hypothetical protein
MKKKHLLIILLWLLLMTGIYLEQKKVGFTTAYIKRKEEIFNPYSLQPDISEINLVDLVKKIIEIK